jgi:glutamate carboxypeptidase
MPQTSLPLRELLASLRREQSAMVELLGRMVRIESPSYEKSAVDDFSRLVAAEWRKRGAKVATLKRRDRGDIIRAELWLGHGRPAGQLLVLGHLDTVYDRGTLSRMPFRIAKGRAWGPATFDMKGGHVLALFAAAALQRAKIIPRKKFVFLWNSDEEIGSNASRSVIESEARRSDAVLVLEPAFGTDGRCKTQRKGVGELEIQVTGHAAHAGINPQDGINSVHELAFQIQRLMLLNNPRRGITVNATVIETGKFTNVIPASAVARVDLRVAHLSDVRTLNKKLHALKPIIKGARLQITGGVNRPPLERTNAVIKLFTQAQQLAQEMGFPLDEASTGGGSDGNFTAALGIPTLDGLGAVGEGAHSPGENVIIRKLPERAALIAALLATL